MPRFATRLPIVPLWLAVAMTGCTAPPRAASVESTSAVDKTRAMLRLDDVRPVPKFPPVQAEESAQPVPTARRYLQKGREAFNQQLWTEATTALERALQIDPHLVEARILLARACMQNGNSALAMSHLQEALKYRPREPAIHQLLGEIASQESRTADAISELRLALLASEAAPHSPERALAHLTLAMALRREGYLRAAVDQLEAYLEAVKNPTREMLDHLELKETIVLYRGKAAGLIGEIQTDLGRHDLAAAAYERAVAESPDDAALRMRWARSLAAAGRTDNALDVVHKMLVAFPEDAKGLALLKEICDSAGQRDRYDEELLRLARTTGRPALRTQLAELLLQRGRAREAMEILQRVVADNPRDVKGHLTLARLHLERGEAAEGLQALAAALRQQSDIVGEVKNALAAWKGGTSTQALVDAAERFAGRRPASADAIFLHALVLVSEGRTDQAAGLLRAALRVDKSFGPAWSLLAELLIAQKKWAEAASACESAIEDGAADARVYLLKGRACEALDQPEDAEEAYLEAFERNRKSPEALYALGQMTERRGDRRRCEMFYRRILKDVDPRFAPARERLVRMYAATGSFQKLDEQLDDIERLGLSGPEVERCKALRDALHRGGPMTAKTWRKYRRRLAEIAQRYPRDTATLLDLAASEEMAKEYSKAIEHLKAALRIDSDDPRIWEALARVQTSMLDFDGASETFRRLMDERPRITAYRRSLKELALNLADFPAAIEHLRALLAVEKSKEERGFLTIQLISALLRAERGDEAVDEARRWLEAAPKDAERRATYLAALGGAKRREEAVDQARTWLESDPENERLRLQYLEQLQLAGRSIEAQQRVLDWLEQEPDDTSLNTALIRLFLATEQWDEAIEAARSGAEPESGRVIYENLLAICYVSAKRYDEAIRFYEDRARPAEGLDAYNALINVLIAAERYEEAEKLVSNLLQMLSAHKDERAPTGELALRIADMRRRLASIYQMTGRERLAIEQLEQIYALLPEDAGINNDLGYTLADAGERIDEAEKMIRLAVARWPRQSAYLDSLGWVRYKRGDFAEAIKYLERAIRHRESDDAVYHDHLGDALYRAGQLERAREHWEKARALIEASKEPSLNPDYQRVRKQAPIKLRQLAEGKPVDVAPLAPPPTSTPAADDAEP